MKLERWQRLKEIPSNVFWKIVLPFFRLKWWFNGREERKRFREREKWDYMLHGYTTCIFCREAGMDKVAYCYRPRRFLWRHHMSPKCSKSSKCKYYFYDPIKG